MRSIRIWIGSVLGALVIVAGGIFVYENLRPAPSYDAWLDRTIEVVEERHDADALATAALLVFQRERIRAAAGEHTHDGTQRGAAALDFIERAARAAPSDPAVLRLLSSICESTTGCDARRASSAFQEAAPENAAAWLLPLQDAWNAQDSAAVDAILQQMAQGTRFDIYWNDMVVRIADVLDYAGPRVHGKSIFRASKHSNLVSAAGLVAARVPALSALSTACRDAGPGRHEDCRRIAELMQNGDSLLVQSLGLGFIERWAAQDPEQALAAARQRRMLDWLRHRSAGIEMSPLRLATGRTERERLALMREHRREQDVMQALLVANEIPLEPPADWSR